MIARSIRGHETPHITNAGGKGGWGMSHYRRWARGRRAMSQYLRCSLDMGARSITGTLGTIAAQRSHYRYPGHIIFIMGASLLPSACKTDRTCVVWQATAVATNGKAKRTVYCSDTLCQSPWSNSRDNIGKICVPGTQSDILTKTLKLEEDNHN